jgi:hypothetical protein
MVIYLRVPSRAENLLSSGMTLFLASYFMNADRLCCVALNDRNISDGDKFSVHLQVRGQ